MKREGQGVSEEKDTMPVWFERRRRVEGEAWRVVCALRMELHLKRKKQKDVEEHLGRVSSAVSNLFNRGRIQVRDILRVLDMLGVQPGEFFFKLYVIPWLRMGAPRPKLTRERILELLE
jgi:hypothetical protein